MEKNSGSSHSPAVEFTSCRSIHSCSDSYATLVLHKSEYLGIFKPQLHKPHEDNRYSSKILMKAYFSDDCGLWTVSISSLEYPCSRVARVHEAQSLKRLNCYSLSKSFQVLCLDTVV